MAPLYIPYTVSEGYEIKKDIIGSSRALCNSTKPLTQNQRLNRWQNWRSCQAIYNSELQTLPRVRLLLRGDWSFARDLRDILLLWPRTAAESRSRRLIELGFWKNQVVYTTSFNAFLIFFLFELWGIIKKPSQNRNVIF